MKFECYILFAVLPWYGAQELRSFDYEFYPGLNGWLKLHTAVDGFHGAKKTCENEGAVIASPTGLDFLEKMKDLMKIGFIFPNSIYTGIRAKYPKGSYLTVDHQPLGKITAKWSDGEPNYDRITGDEVCVLLHPNGTLATVNCVSRQLFICYKKVETPEEEICSPTDIDKEYTSSNVTGNCYKFVTAAESWNDALETCMKDGAYLSPVYTVEKAVMLKEMYEKKMLQQKTDSNVHLIGFKYWHDVNEWMTVFGQSIVEAAFWYGGEQIYFVEEKPVHKEMSCGAINILSDKPEILVVSCEEKYPYVCEKPDEVLDRVE